MSVKQIAIDGPAGAGKSTISKQLAGRLGYIYVDTGAMYRAAALFCLEKAIDIRHDIEAVLAVLDEIAIDFKQTDSLRILLNGRDVSDEIRTNAVSMGASDIALIPQVRLKLVALQREIAQRHNVVMDGRDIGTYVLPDAAVKIFLTASIEERAKRRFSELKEKGTDCTYCSVLEDMKKRDKNDSEREFAPLKQAENATLLDTSALSLEESVETAYRLVIEKLSHLDL